MAIDEGLYVPLGQSTPLRAYSSKLSGLPLAPAPVFWGVDKTLSAAPPRYRGRVFPPGRPGGPFPFPSLEAACVGYWQ